MPKACWKAPSLPLTRSRWKWWFREEKQPENGESQFASSRWTSHSGWGLLKQQNWTKLLPQPLKWKGPEFRGGEAICNVWHDQTTHSNLMCSICNWALLSFNLMTDYLPVWWLRTGCVSHCTQVYKVPGWLFWFEESQAGPSADFLYFCMLLAYWVPSLGWLQLDSCLCRIIL